MQQNVKNTISLRASGGTPGKTVTGPKNNKRIQLPRKGDGRKALGFFECLESCVSYSRSGKNGNYISGFYLSFSLWNDRFVTSFD